MMDKKNKKNKKNKANIVDNLKVEPSIHKLTVQLNIKPNDENLFFEALTHSSYAHEHSIKSNERLEFLGDSVLGLIVCRFLYEEFPESEEGVLAKIKAIIVSAPILAKFAKELQLEKYIMLGEGELKSGGRSKQNILADLFEAIIGAYFLNFGLDSTADFIIPLLRKALPEIMYRFDEINAKTNLQEITQAKGFHPDYRLINEEGPPHDKTFTVEVFINGIPIATGSGKTIKEAQNKAASAALKIQKKT